MRKFVQIAASILFIVVNFCCGYSGAVEDRKISNSPDVSEQFANYWYNDKTEINEYSVHQVINGIEKKAGLSMTFATETFSKSRHVITKDPNAKVSDQIIVLHNNNLLESGTGSTMSSIFTPINLEETPYSISAFSSTQNIKYQHTTKIDKIKNSYEISFSSFADYEGKDNYQIQETILEDALFNRIRIAPKSIPVGTVNLLKSLNIQPANQAELKPAAARIQFLKSESTSTCKVEYMHSDRTVIINFDEDFPHKITSWSVHDTNNYSFEATLKKTNKVVIVDDEIKS